MRQPKKLDPQINYSGEAYMPEIDEELSEFIEVKHESLDIHELYENLKDLGADVTGSEVFINEEINIDNSQFEEKTPQAATKKSKKDSFLKKIFK